MKHLTVEEKINNALNWIEHLPDYEQCHTSDLELSEPTAAYCSLGVANKIMGCSNYCGRRLGDDDAYESLVPGLGLMHDVGTASDLKITGKDIEGYLTGPTSIVIINDILRCSFDEIQDILMAHPENFFEPEVALGIREYFGERDDNE